MTTSELVEKIEQSFEKVESKGQEPKTLAEAVSNSLIKIMPRISPELFDLKRNANIPITKLQEENIINRYLGDTVFTEKIYGKGNSWTESEYRLADGINLESIATIPFFAYAVVSGESELVFKECCEVSASTELKIYPAKGTLNNFYFPYAEKGTTILHTKARWESPFKLDVNVKVPKIPKSFREMGDEAISLYYQSMKEIPKDLRRTTSLIPPRIGVLWAPIDESLYVSGKIPKPKETPRPIEKRCPVLVLDISGEKRNYKHAVAAWNIGEELPFKNWLTEYTEGGGL